MLKKQIILLFLGVLISGVLFSQKSWYVAPSGSNSNAGTIDSPFKTVGNAVSRAISGDEIYLREGVYRETVTVTKNNIKIFAYQDETPILKGSDLMSDWIKQGDYWKKNVAVQPQQVFVDGNNPLQQIGWPWPDDVPLGGATKRYHSQVGEDLNDMAAGRFFWQGGVLYIWLKDSSDPNNHEVEVSQRRDVLVLRSSKNSYVKGVQVEHSNVNTFREQGSAVYLGTGCVLDECLIQWCDFGGVSMGDNSKVINSRAIHNGDVGIHSSGDENFLVQNTELAYNNYRNFFSQWHAGGFKGATNTWGTIENCEIHNNNGSGVWFDYCHTSAAEDDVDGDNFYPIIVRNNYFHNNGTGNYKRKEIFNNATILIEVSEQAYIYNNIIDTFEYRGIWVSSAWKSFFVNNVLANGKKGTYYTIDGGASYVDWAWVKEDIIANNILYNNETDFEIRMMPDDGGKKFYDNLCQNNLIYRGGKSFKMRYGSSSKTSIEKWQSSTPFGENTISLEPNFSDALFHLSDNSPCINAGYDVINDVILKDYEGNNRIIGPSVDMGVFESAVGSSEAYNAFLKELIANSGSLTPNFAQDIYVYYDTLPDNTKTIPNVVATPVVSNATVEIVNAKNVQSSNIEERTTEIKVTSENGFANKTYQIIFYSKNTNGIESLDNDNLFAFPNPTNGLMYIDGIGNIGDLKIKVIDTKGEIIYKKSVSNLNEQYKIDLRNQSKGLYFITIASKYNTKIIKVFVN